MDDLIIKKKTTALAKKTSLSLANDHYKLLLDSPVSYFDTHTISDEAWKKKEPCEHQFLKIIVKSNPIPLIHYICYECGFSKENINDDHIKSEKIDITSLFDKYPRILRKATLEFKKKIVAFSILTSYRTTADLFSVSQMVISSWKKEITTFWSNNQDHKNHRVFSVVQNFKGETYTKSLCLDCGMELSEISQFAIDITGKYHIAPEWLKK